VSYLLVALLFSAMLASLMVFKPTRRQKQIIALRDEARRLGMQIQVVANVIVDQDVLDRSSVWYFLPWRAAQLEKLDTSYWLLLRDKNSHVRSDYPGWRWYGNKAPAAHRSAIGKVMDELPEYVGGLSGDERGLGIYWREQGDFDKVCEIKENIDKIINNII
jgi:hypothetical protein